MIASVEKALSTRIEPALVKRLLEYYEGLKQKFFLGQYEPSQLNTAKFVEVALRILQYVTKGSYTGFNKKVSLDALAKELENYPQGKFPDSIRIHIPRTLRAIYDIRSRRGVAHVGEIDPNVIDATFAVAACDWIMEELIRLYAAADPQTAQEALDSIVQKKVPLIEEFGEDLKVLNTSLSVPDKVLLVLYQKHPNYVSMDDLRSWIRTKSSSHISTVMHRLDNDAKIHRKGKEIIITRKGIEYVESRLLKGT